MRVTIPAGDEKTGSNPHDLLPVEEKESYRCLEALINTKDTLENI